MNIITDQDATELYDICKEITIPMMRYKHSNTGQSCRAGRAFKFGNHRAALLGYVIKRREPRINGPQLSAFSNKHPELYACLVKIADKYFPEHRYKAIQLNNNVVCPPHLDRHNNGPSIIFSVGEYVGCKLQIEYDDYILEANTRNTILSFDGSKNKHWNTPLVSGNKYSFVFYA
jgi:hypothetical protein